MVTDASQGGAQEVKQGACTKKSMKQMRLRCHKLEMTARVSTKAVRTGTDTTQDDCQVDTANLTKDVVDSFPNVKNRGEMIPLDTVLLTEDGGSKVHDCPADCYNGLCNLLAKDMRRDIYLHADSHVRVQISHLDSDSIDSYMPVRITDIGTLEAGE